MKARMLISIIAPVFNEEDNLGNYYQRVCSVLDSLSENYDFEIIFTDNNSTDGTFAGIRKLAAGDPRIRAVRLSRNFGYQRSIWTGYSLSRGDAVLELDADLQDPPEMLLDFLEKWRDGAAVVYGIRESRAEGFFVQFMRKLYYRLLKLVSDDELPNDAGDFMLIDRKVVDHIKRTNDHNIYIRGFVFSLGYPAVGISYARSARQFGVSKFPFFKMVRLAADAFVLHSVVPLRLAFYLGFLFSGLSMILVIFYVSAQTFFNANWPAGFTTTTVLQLLTIAITSTLLGIIGEYLARIYSLLRMAPMTTIVEEINLNTGAVDEKPHSNLIR